MTTVRKKTRAWAPGLLVLVIALLVVGTLTNQVRINHTQATLTMQARNGQKALNRQCRLLPIAKKLYADELDRGKITADDYKLVVSTAVRACPRTP